MQLFLRPGRLFSSCRVVWTKSEEERRAGRLAIVYGSSSRRVVKVGSRLRSQGRATQEPCVTPWGRTVRARSTRALGCCRWPLWGVFWPTRRWRSSPRGSGTARACRGPRRVYSPLGARLADAELAAVQQTTFSTRGTRRCTPIEFRGIRTPSQNCLCGRVRVSDKDLFPQASVRRKRTPQQRQGIVG